MGAAATETVEMICISCPIGCRLSITRRGEAVAVSGHQCPRGEAYGVSEVRDPRRIVTATVATTSPSMPRLPVRTTDALPLKRVPELLDMAYRLLVAPPVTRGQILIRDVLGTGIDLVASRTLGDGQT
ncbi:DUF1667 domain-containing protein [Salinispira pacifica]